MDIKKYAKKNNVPIITDDGLKLLLDIIEKYNISSILEIGTAIGYSAAKMSELACVTNIVTIEKNEEAYLTALSNTDDNPKIRCVFGDALERNISDYFDLLFIDGAKSQYQKFFDLYISQVKYVFVDNIDFHGFVENPQLTKNRNTRQLVNKIKRFKNNMLASKDFNVEYFSVGDGVLFIQKK